MWIIAVYDSIVACRERESLPTDYRKKKRWRLKNLLPSTTAVLSLLLAISVGVQYLPKEYYLDTLEKIRIESAREKMEIIPELAGRTIELVGR